MIKKIGSRNRGVYFCIMNFAFLKDYRAIIVGAVLSCLLTTAFIKAGIILVSRGSFPLFVYYGLNTLSFLMLWSVTAYFIHKHSIWKVAGLIGLLTIVTLADNYLEAKNNPFTMPALILFWLGAASLILPRFFKKYQIAIYAVYSLVLSYFFIDFAITPNYASSDRFNFSSVMLSPIPVFGALWAYEQWRWLRTLKDDKAKAELALLKSQVNPHFFFNTLNNLYGLVVERSEKAPEVILKLSDMMRYTIYEGKEELVSLQDEIIYLENYIELHKIRYQKRVDFQFKKQVDKDYKIAPLLFINLLENAIKHGVESQMGGAYVHLKLIAQENQIMFTIENNFEAAPTEKPAGIGLENLKKRLVHLYPGQYQLKINKEALVYRAELSISTEVI
ncbi:MAG: sensor histidine kinase [Bacteroidota bacterium]